MDRTLEDRRSAAREAYERHAWHEALALLTEADRAGELEADDLALLGEVLWWTGDGVAASEARQRAHAAYLEAGDPTGAATMALKLAVFAFQSMQMSVASGWAATARRLLAGQPESAATGWLLVVESLVAMDRSPEQALELARETLAVAQRVGDRGLTAMALMEQGSILAEMGRLDEGRPLMDEAMVAAVSGDVEPFTTGIVYCSMIGHCERIADYRRAGEWTEAAARWCERQSINAFPGVCRVHRAEIMALRGAWTQAEAEARLAQDELSKFGMLYFSGQAFYAIGEIRLRMGDLSGAEDAFRQAHEQGTDPSPGMQLVQAGRGRVEAASSSLRRSVEEETDRLTRVRLLPAWVDLALATGEAAAARRAADELLSTAELFRTAALHAIATQADGAVRLVEGDAEGAADRLRHAVRHWKDADAPYEMARARMVLAEAHRALGDEDSAALEIGAARAAFERLGAALDLRRASEALGEADGAGRRVKITSMFTDIVGSTPLVEAIGDEAWEDVLRWHDDRLRACFARHRGREVAHPGDGFFAVFPDPASALACAVEIQQSLAEHRRSAGFAPQVRIGVHVSEATERGQDYGGKGVHEAARIGAIAEGGEILTSVETFEAGGNGLTASPPREVALKGLSEPVRVVAVDWR